MGFEFGSGVLSVGAVQPQMLAASIHKSAPTSAAMPFTTSTAQTAPPVQPASNSQSMAALRKFEAAVLSTFVQAMMPKQADSVFGSGFAGDMWKTQMSEKIADQLAQAGGIGIAYTLLQSYQREGDSVTASPKTADGQ